MRNLMIGIFVIILVIVSLYIDYHWTKSSLEDLSGHKVSDSTVIWTMMNTGNGRR